MNQSANSAAVSGVSSAVVPPARIISFRRLHSSSASADTALRICMTLVASCFDDNLVARLRERNPSAVSSNPAHSRIPGRDRNPFSSANERSTYVEILRTYRHDGQRHGSCHRFLLRPARPAPAPAQDDGRRLWDRLSRCRWRHARDLRAGRWCGTGGRRARGHGRATPSDFLIRKCR
ncbi:hypothetical protein RHECNPAF_930058 [Rhizobium etli CNPAF512]|nr:hypothetical protein RHECNPAF_930058 [Rhizobium etli CNPAF512]